MVNLKINTVIAIVISVYTVSTKLSSTSWPHVNGSITKHITTGLKPRLTVQEACTGGLSN